MLNQMKRKVKRRQVKRRVIISNKHGMYELPHELPNDLRLENLRKLGDVWEISKIHRIID